MFELEPVAGKKVTVDFSAPELSSLGGLTLVREYEKSNVRSTAKSLIYADETYIGIWMEKLTLYEIFKKKRPGGRNHPAGPLHQISL